MSEITRIQDQFQKSFEGDAWHGPPLWNILETVSAEQADARPLANAHSIREITLHLSAWQKAVNARLRGKPVTEPEEGDWPSETDASESVWQQTLSDLKSSYENIVKTLAALPESKLDQPIADGFSTYYVTMHGLIQHNLYHAGQIVILRKAL